jgi:hypothetical protein
MSAKNLFFLILPSKRIYSMETLKPLMSRSFRPLSLPMLGISLMRRWGQMVSIPMWVTQAANYLEVKSRE